MNAQKVKAKTINVHINKDNDQKWRVRDNNGQNKGSLDVNSEETIKWHIKKSPMEFRFLEGTDIDAYFEYEKGLFKDGRTQRVEKQKKLSLTVKKSAPKVEVEYDVEVLDTGEMVVGNSRPKLIIR